jgi:hypothetical protein
MKSMTTNRPRRRRLRFRLPAKACPWGRKQALLPALPALLVIAVAINVGFGLCAYVA